MEFEITPSKAAELVQTFVDPNKAKEMLIKLNEGKQFARCIESPIGKEILKDALERRAQILASIINNIGGEEELDRKLMMEYKIVNGIIIKWAEKIARYMDETDKANAKIMKRRIKNGK